MTKVVNKEPEGNEVERENTKQLMRCIRLNMPPTFSSYILPHTIFFGRVCICVYVFACASGWVYAAYVSR